MSSGKQAPSPRASILKSANLVKEKKSAAFGALNRQNSGKASISSCQIGGMPANL